MTPPPVDRNAIRVKPFAYRDDRLYAEDVDLAALAARVGTPFYCYSEAALRARYRVLRDTFADAAPLIAYSVKANGNLSVLRVMAQEGAGADVVSAGELKRALGAGVAPDRIVFSGVGKTRDELGFAVGTGIRQFNVESEAELLMLDDAARSQGRVAPIAFRINPDVAAGGHANISTGKAGDKFGVAIDDAPRLYARAATLAGIAATGVDLHIGSQIVDVAPFREAFARIGDLIDRLRAEGRAIARVDVGGGLGVAYKEGDVEPSLADYAAAVRDLVASRGLDLVLEPGRYIAAPAGVLIARITLEKLSGGRRILVLDAGMNDLLRPALYGAYHEIVPLQRPVEAPRVFYDVVGPVCESTDLFARDRLLPPLRSGDLVALMTAGAYGAVLSSAYNARLFAPEVMAHGRSATIIRRRPSFEEMIALEAAPILLDEIR